MIYINVHVTPFTFFLVTLIPSLTHHPPILLLLFPELYKKVELLIMKGGDKKVKDVNELNFSF